MVGKAVVNLVSDPAGTPVFISVAEIWREQL